MLPVVFPFTVHIGDCSPQNKLNDLFVTMKGIFFQKKL